MTELVPLGYIESMSVSPDHFVEFRIYARDPAQNGRWVLDERPWLCATGCDDLVGGGAPASSVRIQVRVSVNANRKCCVHRVNTRSASSVRARLTPTN